MKNNDKAKAEAKAERGEIAKEILKGIGMAGLLVIAIAAPGASVAIPKIQRQIRWLKKYTKKSVNRSLENLKRRGLVELTQGRRGLRLELTKKGRLELARYETRKKILQKKRWDGKWHILIFDIQESRKNVRDAVRHTLRALGFYRLQDSVWVFPYDCETVLELLRTEHRVRYDALYIVAQRIGNDGALRDHFGLKKR